MYRCVGTVHYGRQLSDDKWSVCGYVTVVSGCDSIVSTTLIVDTVLYSTTDLGCVMETVHLEA